MYKQPRTETPADSNAAENAATSVYDVPSNCVRCNHFPVSKINTAYVPLGPNNVEYQRDGEFCVWLNIHNVPETDITYCFIQTGNCK